MGADATTQTVLIASGVAAAAVVLGLSLTALRNAKASLLGRRVVTFVALVGIAIALGALALNRT